MTGVCVAFETLKGKVAEHAAPGAEFRGGGEE